MSNTEARPVKNPEPEYTGSIWKHPWMIYVVLNGFLFGLILLIGYLAWENGWIPNRGIGN